MISYLITDPQFYTKKSDFITTKLYEVSKKHKIDYACLRDKEVQNYKSLAKTFIITCNALDIKPILHTFWREAVDFGSWGVHFAANDFNNIPLAKVQNLFVVASTHSLEEANEAVLLGADLITVSPVFYTPNKNKPLGLEKLKEITDKIPNKCIALGGILESSQIQMCKDAGAVGYASIRYFLK
ncbi:MAG: thiamine phosphate synthase [Campylobacteraceae bacterium]|jgi:thiamine-phosphate pyrophosphorylase|nr:thiamine phosphate synthase [Campylobacteraceae bacterium]